MNLHETATAVLSYALQSGLLLGVGLLLPRLLKIRHPRTLLTYWRALLVVVVLLPVLLAGWTPPQTLPLLRLEAASVETVTATLPPSVAAVSGRNLLVAAAVVTLLGLIRLFVGLVFLNRCRRAASPLTPFPMVLGALQRRFKLEVPILVSDRLTVPFTFGWIRPVVMVPPSFHTLSVDEQEGVACHELLHIRRRDWAMTVLEEILRAALWFHPAVWILLPKIALSREMVVDAGTVRMTGKRRQYLEALWQIVCSQSRPTATLALPLLGRSNVFERVQWLKKERTMSKGRVILFAVVMVLAVGGAGVLGAAVFSPVAHDAMDVAPIASSDEPEKEKQKVKSKAEKKQLRRFESSEECNEITHPTVGEKTPPKYPESARAEKVMGMVVVETVISEEGSVEAIKILESPDDRLSEAATEAVRQWQFEPALCDGRPVAVYYNLTVNFRLK